MGLEFLARLQFGLTISFHYIFPPLTIGLSLILVYAQGAYLKTKDPVYRQMVRFWVRIFGLVFALGVATGIVMEFQFGTNWATYSRFVGDVFGSALAAEGIFAFFLESGFLAILLFGWDKVSPRFYFISTVLVAFGTHFSAVWIVVANSWQQTPAGHRVVEFGGSMRAEIVDIWQVVFNPSFFDRITHVFMGAWQAGAFFVLSVSAFYLIKKRHIELARKSIKIALVIAVFASVMQLITGHHSGNTIARTQPAKLAAFEGHFPASAPAGAYLFGWVDEEKEKTTGLEIPGLLSFLVHWNADEPVTGLKAFSPADRPPVNIVFQSYHLMVVAGMILILISLVSAFYWWRDKLFTTKWLLTVLVFSVLLPQIANQLGWFSAEVGRQPWIVYGLLRTGEALSVSVGSGQVITSLVLFVLIYLLLFVLFIYLLDEKIRHGPDEEVPKMTGPRA
ncbi:MAG: cytochrome ubiquinol oxidase subunit I [Candidatus Zixiibacteriota bacterium]|nr:MAG: cytochrome ubiquinol oxidase subunit I [candidate division Zixibacteria bacterium]